MQAIGLLSRREHSRQELRAKLLALMRRREREEAAFSAAAAKADRDLAEALRDRPSNGIDDAFLPMPASARASTSVAEPAREPAMEAEPGAGPGRDPEAEVDALLDWLVANKYLSDQRFVESRVHARLQKQGTAMIRHELARHGLILDPEQAQALRETEFARAHALWSRKFGEPAADARERARQARFLVSRGFASEVVRRIVGGESPD